MANDCDFKLHLSGKKENLDKFSEKYENYITKTTLATTQDGKKSPEDTYSGVFESVDDVEEWNSKWTTFTKFNNLGDKLEFFGYSAWETPVGFWKKISKDFKLELRCEWQDKASDIAGIFIWKNGILLEETKMNYWYYIYKYDTEQFWYEVETLFEFASLEEVKNEYLAYVWEILDESEMERITKFNPQTV